ncbi:hypothetical protein ZHAS_00013066 [Anopheles sinensis]|uniref:Uncharacterized protein n=1 Tax=Anopheles sinensis TaxID=74873 RepID=A0A084W4T6_ANOSI|nr:hypothetical protein ZHAS_00013066 [Anopheles sinensis]
MRVGGDRARGSINHPEKIGPIGIGIPFRDVSKHVDRSAESRCITSVDRTACGASSPRPARGVGTIRLINCPSCPERKEEG